MTRRGSVLVVSIWTFAALSSAAVSLTFYASGHLKASAKKMDSFRAAAAFLAATHSVNALYFSENGVDEAVRRRPWLGEVEVPDKWKALLEVHSSPEEGRLNVNSASGPALIRLFRSLRETGRISVDPEETAVRVVRYRAAKPFEWEEELVFIKVPPPDAAVLKSYLTAHSAGRIDLNAADALVIEAVLFSRTRTDERVMKTLLNAVLRFRSAGNVFSRADFTEEGLTTKLRLPRTPEMQAAVSLLLGHSTLETGLLRLRMTYAGKKNAEVIFRPAETPHILFWHETGARRAA